VCQTLVPVMFMHKKSSKCVSFPLNIAPKLFSLTLTIKSQNASDLVDLNVGYSFVNILYRNGDGTLGVDLNLINDVREQHGGGGEALITS
jgi:hypothetical protein